MLRNSTLSADQMNTLNLSHEFRICWLHAQVVTEWLNHIHLQPADYMEATVTRPVKTHCQLLLCNYNISKLLRGLFISWVLQHLHCSSRQPAIAYNRFVFADFFKVNRQVANSCQYCLCKNCSYHMNNKVLAPLAEGLWKYFLSEQHGNCWLSNVTIVN